MLSLFQVLAVFSAVGLLIFIALFLRNPASVFNGFVFDAELALLFITLLCALQLYNFNTAVTVCVLILFAAVVIICFGGVWILIGLFLVNAVKVFRREGHSLKNMLTLIIGVGLLAQMLLYLFMGDVIAQNRVVMAVSGFLVIIELWLAVTANCFVTASLLCRLSRPRVGVNYIIVLGSGLIHGSEVSPLLGGRINAAVKLYKKAVKKGKTPPKLVMSGGQGSDETLPEAEAMRAYAAAQGVPETDILTETKSKTTLENFRFSKQIMDACSGGENYTCGYATSGYHVLRARIYARKAGLTNAKGVGSHTAFYYTINATIREYVAVMLNNKKTAAIQLALITLCYTAAVVMVSFKK